MSFNRKVVSGLGWSGFQMVFDRILGTLVKLILARILFPEDFGIIGMAAVFIAIIQVFREVGMGAALIQKKDDVSELEYNTAFWTTMIWSIVLYGLLFLFAPLIADFYDQPILTDVVRVLGIGILIQPVNLIQQIRLNRNLDFKKLAFINNLANLLASSIAIISAFQGLGVWSLVIQSTGPLILRIPLFYYYGGWRPSLQFSQSAFKKILAFGIYTTGTDILIRIVSQADFLLVGKMLGAYELGIYSFAFLITSTLRTQFIVMIDKVMFPVYSKFQHDIDKLKKYYLNVVKMNTVIMMPLFSLIILYAADFVGWLFPQWTESTVLIQIFTVGVIINSVANSFSSFLRGINKPHVELKIQLFRALFYLCAICVGYYFLRLNGVAWGYAITSFAMTIVISVILSRKFGILFSEVWKTIQWPVITMIILLSTGWAMTFIVENVILRMFISLLILFLMLKNVMRDYVAMYKNMKQDGNTERKTNA